MYHKLYYFFTKESILLSSSGVSWGACPQREAPWSEVIWFPVLVLGFPLVVRSNESEISVSDSPGRHCTLEHLTQSTQLLCELYMRCSESACALFCSTPEGLVESGSTLISIASLQL